MTKIAILPGRLLDLVCVTHSGAGQVRGQYHADGAKNARVRRLWFRIIFGKSASERRVPPCISRARTNMAESRATPDLTDPALLSEGHIKPLDTVPLVALWTPKRQAVGRRVRPRTSVRRHQHLLARRDTDLCGPVPPCPRALRRLNSTLVPGLAAIGGNLDRRNRSHAIVERERR